MLKAIGFDLFNTLMVVQPNALEVATKRLLATLSADGLRLEGERFLDLHRAHAVARIRESEKTGVETHNRFWIASALKDMGYDLSPDSPLISNGVEAYFTAFYEMSQVIPGTLELLEELRPHYRLGLLSNFTHFPACSRLLKELGLERSFDFMLISGGLGFRKPHPCVFDLLCLGLGVGHRELLFVGDDPRSDIQGALNAGIRAVWYTYVLDNNLSHAPGYVVSKARPEDVPAPRVSSWQDLKSLLQAWK